MVFDLSKITNLGPYTKKTEQSQVSHSKRTIYLKNDRAFLVQNHNTIEIRCDGKLAKFLTEKYESVMESRYFGRGGIEIVLAGQLNQSELADLVRLSYNLTD